MELISIIGYDRSGTTFLGSYFSNFSDCIFYAGEIDKGIKRFFAGKNKVYSCGSPYSKCEIWSKIFPFMSTPSDLDTLFKKIKELTGAKIIIDSSKSFGHLQKCKELFQDKFYAVHIKRNPKRVVLSRKKIRKSKLEKKYQSPAEISQTI